MEGTVQTKDGTHIIFAGNVSEVHKSFRTSQNYGSLRKIVLVIPEDMLPKFKTLRTEISKYCTEVVVTGIDITDISHCALRVFEIVTTEKKQGRVVTLNITDTSVFAFTIAASIAGSVTKSKVVTSSANDTPVSIPLVPYGKIAMKRYEILKALGDSGAENTESLKTKLKKLFKTAVVEDSNLSTQLKILEDRGFILREKNRQSKTIKRTSLGLLVQMAYEDYIPLRPKK